MRENTRRAEKTRYASPNKPLVHDVVEPTQNLTTKISPTSPEATLQVDHLKARKFPQKSLVEQIRSYPFLLISLFTSAFNLIHSLPKGSTNMADAPFVAVKTFRKTSHDAPVTDRVAYPSGQPQLWAGKTRPITPTYAKLCHARDVPDMDAFSRV